MTKNNIIVPLTNTRNVAVKLTKKYGVAIVATTAALVVFSKIAADKEQEDVVVVEVSAA